MTLVEDLAMFFGELQGTGNRFEGLLDVFDQTEAVLG